MLIIHDTYFYWVHRLMHHPKLFKWIHLVHHRSSKPSPIFSLIYNVYGHLGFELYPKGFNRHWLGKWLNTSISHNMHHQYFKGNYGLYFTFWDRLMNTMHSKYDQTFEEVTSRKKA